MGELTLCPDSAKSWQIGAVSPGATPVVAVVLAAGAGTRFRGDGHKLDARIDDRPLLARAVDAAVEAAIGPVVVVTGSPVATALPPTVVNVVNDRWAEGQMTSLRAGLAAAVDLGGSVVVVGLGDQPFVTAAAWRAVAAEDAPIAVATYDGRRGHPVRLAQETWELLPERGDEGARTLMRLRPDLVTEVPCEGSPIDIDTVEDLRRWQNSSSTSSPSTGRSTKPGR
jgi:CTP:molybdopterin cytidylyltransferase MocA